MKLSKTICFALLATMPFAALATKSSSIPLTGGTAAPNQSITITGDALYETTYYDVSCHLRMQSKSGDLISHIQIEDHIAGPIQVNSHPLPDSGQSLIYVNEDNFITVGQFRDYTNITIRNLDRDNSLTVSDCVATPSVD